MNPFNRNKAAASSLFATFLTFLSTFGQASPFQKTTQSLTPEVKMEFKDSEGNPIEATIDGSEGFFNIGLFECPFKPLENHYCMVWYDEQYEYSLAYSANVISDDVDQLKSFIMIDPVTPGDSQNLLQLSGVPDTNDNSIIMNYLSITPDENWILKKMTLIESSDGKFKWQCSNPTKVNLTSAIDSNWALTPKIKMRFSDDADDVWIRFTPELTFRNGALTASVPYQIGGTGSSVARFVDIPDISGIGKEEWLTATPRGKAIKAFPMMPLVALKTAVKTQTGMINYGAFHPATDDSSKEYGMLDRLVNGTEFGAMNPAPEFSFRDNGTYYADLNQFNLSDKQTVISVMLDHSTDGYVSATLYPDIINGNSGWSTPAKLDTRSLIMGSSLENVVGKESQSIAQITLPLDEFAKRHPYIRLYQLSTQ